MTSSELRFAGATLEDLFGALRHPVVSIREGATRTLALLFSDVRRATVELGTALRDDSPWVRYFAWEAVRALYDETAQNVVIEALDDTRSEIRTTAVETAGRFIEVLPALERALSDPAEDVRREAERVMARLEELGFRSTKAAAVRVAEGRRLSLNSE